MINNRTELQREMEWLDSDAWYDNLVTDCKAIVVESLYRSRQEVIEGWHEVGKRILTDPNYQKFAKGNGEIKKRLARDIGASVQTQFYEKFPTLESMSELPEGKNISWHKITKNYLPAPTDTDRNVPESCTCPHCGNIHRKFLP